MYFSQHRCGLAGTSAQHTLNEVMGIVCWALFLGIALLCHAGGEHTAEDAREACELAVLIHSWTGEPEKFPEVGPVRNHSPRHMIKFMNLLSIFIDID